MDSELHNECSEQLDLFGGAEPCRPADGWQEPSHPLFCPGQSKLPRLYLGTSSWSFPGWKDLVYQREYTEKQLAHEGLKAYSQFPLFRCVSLDKSYYRPLPQREYSRLAAQVDDEFRFVVKAPRDLLTPRPGSAINLERFTEQFLAPLSTGLKSKLGVVLLQFPPGSSLEAGSSAKFLDQLGALLQGLPTQLDFALEVRDASLLGPSLAQALRGTSVSLCGSVHPQLPPVDQQFIAVPPNPGTPIVLRWNLRPSLSYQEAKNSFRPFNALASPDPNRRHQLARIIARALQAGRTVYLTVNNKAEGSAPLSLKALLDELIRL